jgi:hypothetical protein
MPMSDALFPRSTAAQRARPCGWIGIYAGEQLERFISDTETIGALSFATTRRLRLCLQGVERHVEGMCHAGVKTTAAGLPTRYGFPRSTDCPWIASVLYENEDDPAQPAVKATMSGLIRGWTSERSEDVTQRGWPPIVTATARGDWPAAGAAVIDWMARCPGTLKALTDRFARQDPREQYALIMLGAGSAGRAAGMAGVVSLPALDLPADAIRFHFGGGAA